MKKLLVLCLCIFSAGILFAQDLKLDEIMAKYFKAIGQDKLAKIQTMKMTGKVSQMGMEMAISIVKKRPNLSRTEVDVQGSKVISAVDGQTGWMIVPMTGSSDPQDMPAEQLESAKKGDMDGPLANWKDKENKLELVGKENLDGIQVYNLKMTSKDEDVSNYYIDCTKFMLVKVKSKVMQQGQLMDVETKFSDFKDINGIPNFYKMETFSNGQSVAVISFDSIEFDLAVDNSIFAKPAAK